MSFGEAAHWFFDTAGIGGVIVVTVILTAAAIYIALTRWIIEGGEAEGAKPRRRIR